MLKSLCFDASYTATDLRWETAVINLSMHILYL